jgi:uncharacterized radical SAM superfamily Fe-S cluster-containing enzyme
LCPHHEQHTCIWLIEITKKCSLWCPTCYANATSNWISLDLITIEKMMDFYQDSEYNNAEILQISWWEPTEHSEILEILKMAKEKQFKYIMLNTNWVRIAEDEEFAEKLWDIKWWFELYLQFDTVADDNTQLKLRWKSLLEIKKQAIKNIQKYKIPTTLVATIENWVNNDWIWELIKFWMEQPFIRWINFQPVAFFWRWNYKTANRSTLSWIIDNIVEQTNWLVLFDDLVPLPCDPDKVAITYFYKKGKQRWVISRNVDILKHLDKIKNTLAFNLDDILETWTDKTENKSVCCSWTSCNPWNWITKLIAPKLLLMSEEKQIDYINNNFFRITIKSFIDIYNFDIKSVQKDCVHIITPDLKKYPFSTYNMFYRQ